MYCTQSCQVMAKRFALQNADLEKASAEVAVLARALEIKLEDNGHTSGPGCCDFSSVLSCELLTHCPSDNNPKNSLVYQLAQRKQENHALALDLAGESGRFPSIFLHLG